MKKTLLSLLALAIGLLVKIQKAQALPKISDPIVFKSQVGLPGMGTSTELTFGSTGYIGQMIKGFYDWGLAVGGILAAIMIMAGGVLWLSSAGSSDMVGRAKKMITGSIVGLLLLVGSWMILKTINPELLNMEGTSISAIKQERSGCCQLGSDSFESYSKECDNKGGTMFENTTEARYVPSNGNCILTTIGCLIKTDCDGSVEYCLNSDQNINEREKCDGTFKYLFKLNNNACAGYTECKAKTLNCFGVDNGDKCEKSDKGDNITGRCYYGLCYIHDGSESEPCGTEAGAFCSSVICSNLGQEGEKYYKDNSGGRDCNADLYCCYKE